MYCREAPSVVTCSASNRASAIRETPEAGEDVNAERPVGALLGAAAKMRLGRLPGGGDLADRLPSRGYPLAAAQAAAQLLKGRLRVLEPAVDGLPAAAAVAVVVRNLVATPTVGALPVVDASASLDERPPRPFRGVASFTHRSLRSGAVPGAFLRRRAFLWTPGFYRDSLT